MPEVTPFEMPKFEIPKFEMPKIEFPPAFRELAEKSIAQTKEAYEKVRTAAEDATSVLENTYSTASKGATDCGLKMIETARANSNAAFALMTSLMSVKSGSEMVELYSSYLRSQFDTATAQAKDFADHAQKVANETAAPIKQAFSKAA